MFRINYDALGITASLACAIHCAVLPLLFTSLQVFGYNIIDNGFFEVFMITLALGIGLYSLTHGFRKHHRRLAPIVLFLTGILLLVAKQVWHAQQLWFLVPAVLFIVLAHYWNYRLCKRAGCRH